jgi:hypothetical protein
MRPSAEYVNAVSPSIQVAEVDLLQHDLVEGEQRRAVINRTVGQGDLERAALLDDGLALEDAGQGLAHLVGHQVGQVADAAEVHPEDGDLGDPGHAHDTEEGAVAAHAHGHG